MKKSRNGLVKRVMAFLQVAVIPIAGLVTFEVGTADSVHMTQSAPRSVERRMARGLARGKVRRAIRRQERREARREGKAPTESKAATE